MRVMTGEQVAANLPAEVRFIQVFPSDLRLNLGDDLVLLRDELGILMLNTSRNSRLPLIKVLEVLRSLAALLKPILALLDVHVSMLVDSLPVRVGEDEAPLDVLVLFIALHAIVLALAVGLALLVDAQLGTFENDDLLAEINQIAKLGVLVQRPLRLIMMRVLVAKGKFLDAELGDHNVLDDVRHVPEVETVLHDVTSAAAVGAAEADPAAHAASTTAATVDVVERCPVVLHIDEDQLGRVRINELLELVEAVIEGAEAGRVARPVVLLTGLLIEHDQESEVEHADAILQLLLKRALLARRSTSDDAVAGVVSYI